MKRFIYLITTAVLLCTACAKDQIVSTNTNTTDTDTGYTNTNFDGTVSVVFSTTGNATVSGTTDSITATIDGNGVVIRNTSSSKVEYNVSGTTSNGYLKIYSGKKQSLLLNGVNITNPNGAAINIQGPEESPSSGKTTYVVLSGSNSIADGATYSQTPDLEDEKAVLFSEGKLIFSGNGSLGVTATGKSGIASDDYVSLTEQASIVITASAGHGLRGKDSVMIQGGALEITVSANGKKGITTDGSCIIGGGQTTIKTTGNTVVEGTDTAKVACIKTDADFTITGGSLDLTATGTGAKGISADGVGYFRGGDIVIKVSGTNFGTSGGGGGWGGGGGHGPGGGGGWGSTSSGTGAKGIKTDGDIFISGGNISVSSVKHEGIETKGAMEISGGVVYSYSTGDDAINSAGNMTISGGYVCGFSAGNDGLDANGELYIKGGVIYAICTKGSPELAVDANTEGGHKLWIQGGTLVAVGGLENGAQMSQTCYKASSVQRNTWYSMQVGSYTYAFKTPSGGSSLIVSGEEQPQLQSGATCTGGTEYFGGIFIDAPQATGGNSVSLSQYTGGGGWYW